jgi:hypothetical protein
MVLRERNRAPGKSAMIERVAIPVAALAPRCAMRLDVDANTTMLWILIAVGAFALAAGVIPPRPATGPAHQ